MNIRQMANEKPALIGGISAAVIALTLGLVLWHFFGNRSNADPMPDKAFFSDDDGQSFFIADKAKIPPFEHDGKTACRAQVYRCGNGKPFVWLLERYDLAEVAKRQAGMPAGAKAVEIADALEVKSPANKQWIKGTNISALAAAHLLTPACPDGSTQIIRPVLPGEE